MKLFKCAMALTLVQMGAAFMAAPATRISSLSQSAMPSLQASSDSDSHECHEDSSRRSFISSAAAAIVGGILAVGGMPQPSSALVEGSPPPGKTKALPEEYRQGTIALSEMDDQAPVPREAYKKLDSGVIYADLRPGSGPTVQQGSRVNMQWVLRKSNGYFVDSSEVSGSVPYIFTVGDGSTIAGLDEGIRGMNQNGVRRILIPPKLAFVEGLEDGKPGPLPAGFGPRQQMRRVQTVRKDVPGEYIFLEVQVTRVR